MNENVTKASKEIGSFSGKKCVVGIDEAGRGPVLGPMVYCAGVCLFEKSEDLLPNLGVADSKVLSEKQRETIFDNIHTEPHTSYFGYILECLSPNYLSQSMLRRSKYNLNEISHDSASKLIGLCVEYGIIVMKVYVDTVGSPESYQQKLETRFPTIEFCVSKKADSLYPIVSAASICAKVTRDKILSEWQCPELQHFPEQDRIPFGSGYPADPTTKTFIEKMVDPVFGYPTLVRFSWSTAQDMLEKKAVKVLWEDEVQINSKAPGVKSRSLKTFFKKKDVNDENQDIVKESENESNAQIVKNIFFQERNMKPLITL